MPSIKRSGVKAEEVKSGFEAYDGPNPTQRGFYRAKVTSVQVIEAKDSKRPGLLVISSAEAQKGDPKGHAKFNGYPIFARIWFGEEEALVRREQNLYAALGSGDDPNIVYDDDKKVTKIGKKNPVGAIVSVDMRPEVYNGETRLSPDTIYKYKDVAFDGAASDEPEDDEDLMEDDVVEDEETEDEVDEEVEARETELKGTGLPALRKIAKELEITTSGLKKDELIEAILDAEFGEEAEEDDSETDESEEDEVEEDEIEEEDDEEEEEDDESEDDSERRAELAVLNRAQLKAILKDSDHSPEFAVLKRHSDEDLVNAIIELEFGEETPF